MKKANLYDRLQSEQSDKLAPATGVLIALTVSSALIAFCVVMLAYVKH